MNVSGLMVIIGLQRYGVVHCRAGHMPERGCDNNDIRALGLGLLPITGQGDLSGTSSTAVTWEQLYRDSSNKGPVGCVFLFPSSLNPS